MGASAPTVEAPHERPEAVFHPELDYKQVLEEARANDLSNILGPRSSPDARKEAKLDWMAPYSGLWVHSKSKTLPISSFLQRNSQANGAAFLQLSQVSIAGKTDTLTTKLKALLLFWRRKKKTRTTKRAMEESGPEALVSAKPKSNNQRCYSGPLLSSSSSSRERIPLYCAGEPPWNSTTSRSSQPSPSCTKNSSKRHYSGPLLSRPFFSHEFDIPYTQLSSPPCTPSSCSARRPLYIVT